MKYTKYNRSKHINKNTPFDIALRILTRSGFLFGRDFDFIKGKVIPLSMRAGLIAKAHGFKVKWQ